MPIDSAKNEVIIALGSNLGRRNDNLDQAISALESVIGPTQASSRWISAPVLQDTIVGGTNENHFEQNQYINMVIVGSTDMAPLQLLDETQKIEVSLGRPAQHGFHTPRTIDIDIIALGGLEVATERLTLPHKEAINRLFVLLPLAELEPDYRFMLQNKSLAELIADAPEIDICIQSDQVY